MHRLLRVIIILLAVLILLPLLALIALDVVDLGRFSDLIARETKERWGRELRLTGPIDLEIFSMTPSFSVERIRLENAEWATVEGSLFQSERFVTKIFLKPLLRGRLDVASVELIQPRLRLERRKDGRGNWEFLDAQTQERVDGSGKDSAPAPGGLPLLRQMLVTDARLVYADPSRARHYTATLDELRASSSGEAGPVRLTGRGTVESMPLSLGATLGTPRLEGEREPRSPFDFALNLAQARMTAEGHVVGERLVQAVDARIHLEARRLADIFAALDTKLSSEVPSLTAQGHLQVDGRKAAFRDFAVELGQSRLRAKGELLFGSPPRLTADVYAPILRLGDLHPLLPAKTKAKLPPAQKAAAEGRPGTQRILTDQTISFAALRRLNADLSLHIEELIGTHGPALVKDLRGTTRLADGILTIAPLRLVVGEAQQNGTVELEATLDAASEPADVELKMDLRKLALGPLVQRLVRMLPGEIGQRVDDLDPLVQGRLAATANLTSHGRSLHDFADRLDGQISLALEDGQLNSLVLEGLGFDLTEAVAVLFSEDQRTDLQCLLIRLVSEDGVVTPSPFLLSTKDSNVTLGGRIDLGRETLDLTLETFPKDVSVGALRTPIDVKGSFENPDISPRKAPLAARLGIGLGLAALGGPAAVAAILPFIETGTEEAGRCHEVASTIRQIQRSAAH